MKQKRFNKQRIFRFHRFSKKPYSAFNSMNKIVNIGVIVGCALLFLPATIFAQTTSKAQKTVEEKLEEVTILTSRSEIPITETTRLVTVISKKEIAQAPAKSISDLLNYVANVDVVQRGGQGVQADISIRGGSADQTAILLNGINISNPHTGYYSLDIPINISDIERIEILHGPAALIYGFGSFSGGVNIITKQDQGSEIYSNLELGMHKLRDLEFRGTTGTGITQNSLSVGYKSSDGYIENSDFDIFNILWQTQLHLVKQSKLNFQLGYNDKKYGANTFYSAKFPNQYERTGTYIGTIKGEFGSKLKLTPIIYWNRHRDQFDLIKDSDKGRNFHRNDTYGANIILAYKWKFGNTNFGSEFRREEIMSSLLGKPMVAKHRNYSNYGVRNITSASLEHTVKFSKFVASAGAMLSTNTLDDKLALYPSVSFAYMPANKLNLSLSWTKSSRMPTFTNLDYTTETHEGNSGLKSEKSESLELGVKYSRGLFSAYATSFLMWGRNVIDWVKIDTEEGSKYASWNHTKLNTQGVELGAKFNLGSVLYFMGKDANLSVNYTRMNQNVDTENFESKFALAYLRDKLTVQIHHAVYKSFTASWYFQLQKRMGEYEKYENAVSAGYNSPYPSFSTLDLKLNYNYKNINVYINFNNLYNTAYYNLGNIPQAGFWLKGGINYRLRSN